MNDTDFWYIGTPYSKYADGLQKAYELALAAQWELTEAGINTYSPIVSTHTLAIWSKHNPRDAAFWQRMQLPFLLLARGLVVVRGKGWQQSVGLNAEIAEMQSKSKPIHYMDLGTVPLMLLREIRRC